MIPLDDEELKRGRVLVVDDHPENVRLLTALLTKAGYAHARGVGSAVEALERCEVEPPDLVFLDLHMPEVDGFEALRRLRAVMPGDDFVPVVVLTADARPDARRRALAEGATDFLTKPFDATEVILRARNLLAVRAMHRALREQRDALARAQRQKDDLASFIVHDLKNPLTGVLANAQFIEQVVTDPRAKESASDIARSARTLNRMVLDLLDVAQSDDGALRPRLRALDPNEVVAEAQAHMTAGLTIRGQTLRVAVEPSLGAVEADPGLVLRVLENLIDNASRYAPRGSDLAIVARACPEGVEFRVEDHGPGVPPEQREAVFERYRRLDGHGDEVTLRAGRGLGLAFCRVAVSVHGGRIWVEPNEPAGSAFCFVLPRSAAVHSAA